MILACDIGTTSVKAGIVDHKGGLKGFSRVELDNPYAENFSVREWQRGFKKAICALAATHVKKIRAIVISGNGPSIVLLDAEGKPLDPVLLWHHTFADIGGRVRCRSYFLPKLIWLAGHKPRIYEKTRIILPCPEYICYLLSGRAAATLPNQAYRDYFWSDEEIVRFGLDKAKFPEFSALTAPLGSVTRFAHTEFALPQGLPVYCGGPDFVMALLGSGVIVPGSTLDRAGSSEGVNHCAADPITHGDLRALPGIMENTYNISGIIPRSGRLLEQAVDQFYPRPATVAQAFSEALTVRPGADGLLFIPGPERQTQGQGGEPGLGFFTGLHNNHSASHKLRAVMEALGMQLRMLLQKIREQNCSISEMRMCGGQARNPGLAQVKADILKLTVKLPAVLDAELIGGACTAFRALGEYDTLQQAAQSMVHFEKQLEPRKEYEQLYDDLLGRFDSLL